MKVDLFMNTPSKMLLRVVGAILWLGIVAGCQSVPRLSAITQQFRSAPSPSTPIVTVANKETAETRENPDASDEAILSPLIVPPGNHKVAENPSSSPPQPFTFRSDLPEFLPSLWDDTKSLATLQNAAVLGVAAGSAVAIRKSGVDQEVRDDTARHSNRWGSGDVALRQFGEFTYQVPVLAGLYGYSLWQQDAGLHNYSQALVSSYTINAVSTLSLKGIVDTQRPTDNYSWGHYGFPSFHASSLFSLGGVTEEYYGWQASLPIYALGGLVGWSRIDQREHDLSDVLFGAVLGYVIGHGVGANRHDSDAPRKWDIQPFIDPYNGTNGLTLGTRF